MRLPLFYGDYVVYKSTQMAPQMTATPAAIHGFMLHQFLEPSFDRSASSSVSSSRAASSNLSS